VLGDPRQMSGHLENCTAVLERIRLLGNRYRLPRWSQPMDGARSLMPGEHLGQWCVDHTGVDDSHELPLKSWRLLHGGWAVLQGQVLTGRVVDLVAGQLLVEDDFFAAQAVAVGTQTLAGPAAVVAPLRCRRRLKTDPVARQRGARPGCHRHTARHSREMWPQLWGSAVTTATCVSVPVVADQEDPEHPRHRMTAAVRADLPTPQGLCAARRASASSQVRARFLAVAVRSIPPTSSRAVVRS